MCRKKSVSRASSPSSTAKPTMTFPEGDLGAPENAWLKKFDLVKFTEEIAQLGKVRSCVASPPSPPPLPPPTNTARFARLFARRPSKKTKAPRTSLTSTK